MRLLAAALGEDAATLVRAIAGGVNASDAVAAAYSRARAEARARLFTELGDPAPHRLA